MENKITTCQLMTPALKIMSFSEPTYKSLLKYAEPLLLELINIPNLSIQEESTTLRQTLCYKIQAYEQEAKLAGIPALKILTARYVLCAAIDEAIMLSAWGQRCNWHNYTLLSLFHNDTWGGEKFFNILDKAIAEKELSYDVIEIIYFCLSLGFKGKYRISASGENSLQRLRHELWLLLRGDQPPLYLQLHTLKNIIPSKSFTKIFNFYPIFIGGLLILTTVYVILNNKLSFYENTIQHTITSKFPNVASPSLSGASL